MFPNDPETAAILSIVRSTAADEILPRFRALTPDQVDTKSSIEDLVTVADRAAEARLADGLARLLPDAAIVGEEAVAADPTLLDLIGRSGQVVIIDPIDGTANYASGLALFGVIIAVVEDGQTRWGALYDPVRDDWIVAARGQGAWFMRPGHSPRRLHLAQGSDRVDQAFGYIPLFLYRPEERLALASLMPRFRRTTTLRCSCHEYRMKAEGQSDFTLNGMLNTWDHAAGALIYQEAGGICRLLDGRDYAPTLREGRLLNARNEALWSQIAELVAEAGIAPA